MIPMKTLSFVGVVVVSSWAAVAAAGISPEARDCFELLVGEVGTMDQSVQVMGMADRVIRP